MKPVRTKPARRKKSAADREPTKRQIRAELHKPENIEKARRLERGALV